MPVSKTNDNTDAGEESTSGASTESGTDSGTGESPNGERATVALIMSLEAERIIQRHMLAAMGVGVIPIPFVDFIGVTGVQLNMLRQLSKLYGVPFSKNTAKTVISSMVGGAVPAYSALPVATFVQAIPIVGWTLGAGSMAILSGASTYAVGNVFSRHFEKGGTILDLDTAKVKAGFADLFKKGKKIASRHKDDAPADTGTEQASGTA